jgi:peptidyl-prolyl cis-trans isomerase C
MRKTAIIVFLMALLVACSGKDMGQKAGQKGPVLAKVGTSSITQADLEGELQNLPDYAQQMFEGEQGREKFLDEIVKKEILYQEALKKGLDKDPDFNKKVEEFKKLTLVSELLQKEIMDKAKLSDQEVKDYYDKHKEDFAATSQLRASHILVKTEDEAAKILERLKKGEKFDAIAKKESIDTGSAKNGGDLGFFSRGQMVPEFEKAAASLKVGEISKPVKTSFGYHIIKVTDKKTGPVVEFEQVKGMISQKLSGERQKEAFDKYLTDLKKNYPVEINKEELAKISKGKEAQPQAAPEQPAAPKEGPKKEEPKQKAK